MLRLQLICIGKKYELGIGIIALICNEVAIRLSIPASILRRFLAGFLLLLFAFSITPKKVLHDWMVSHTDGLGAAPQSELVQVSKAGFNCDCQQLVAESPFLSDSQAIDLNLSREYFTVPRAYYCPVHTIAFFSHSLRGPPAVS